MLRRFLHYRDIGGPQFAAAGLLFLYLLQCLWLVEVESRRGVPDTDQALRVYLGSLQWRKGMVAGTPQSLGAEAATGLPSAGRMGHLRTRDGFDEDRSPLYYLIAASPMLLRPSAWPGVWQLAAAAPQLFFGVMLGGSLWYVARRLYGNAGGYLALALYCFSPAMIANAAGPMNLAELGAVWGAFGAVFTAIAVAHTLYAPREVILWNWRRILLLGLSLVLAVGNQFSLVVMAVIALPLMFWVAPVRKRAGFVIWAAACVFALLLLFASYFFHAGLFASGLAHARWLDFEPRALLMPIAWAHVVQSIILGSPPLLLALPIAFAAYLAWPRARYFGNTAPLVIAVMMLALAMLSPEFPGQGFPLAALAFLFVFVAGVFADLLETRYQLQVKAALSAMVLASALWNLLQLAKLGRG